ncbi:hypothetical protein ACWCXH_22285 [Kitasatospora sp. NPDC001660]
MDMEQPQLERGDFLREAAALQRSNTDGTRRLTRIAFPVGADVAITTTGPDAAVRLPVTATRDDLHAALAPEGGWAPPDPEPLARLPLAAPAPLLLVWADLLDDLGDLLFTLTGYPRDVGRPDLVPRLDAVTLADATTAVVEVTALGIPRRVRIPLDTGTPLVAVPLEIAEHLLTLGDSPTTDWDYPICG